MFSSWPAGVLRVDVRTAVDVYEREWSPDRVEQWWGEVLAREILSL